MSFGVRAGDGWEGNCFLACSVLARSQENLPALFVMSEFEFGSTRILFKILMSFLVGKNV